MLMELHKPLHPPVHQPWIICVMITVFMFTLHGFINYRLSLLLLTFDDAVYYYYGTIITLSAEDQFYMKLIKLQLAGENNELELFVLLKKK